MNGDSDLHKDFRASIESKLVSVASAIEDKDWDTAKAEVTGAKKLWNRWQEFRDDWIAQLDYGKRLVEENKNDLEAKPLTIFMQGVKDSIDAVSRKLRAGQYEMPQALSKDFAEIRQQLSFYGRGKAAVDNLKKHRKKLPESKANFWLGKLEDLQTQLDNSIPDPESRESWQELLSKTQQDLDNEIATTPEASPEADTMIRGRSGMNLAEVQQAPLVPSVSVAATLQRANQAQNNLWWFNQTSRCIAIIFLAWLGMIELYSGKPTFGAEPLRDYFALLAWGFGAEMTRESITRASQNLGVPLGDKEK
jgi:hypothetical protein